MDEISDYSMVSFIHGKSETASAIILMIKKLQNLFISRAQTLSYIDSKTVKWIRSDGGSVYVVHSLQNW